MNNPEIYYYGDGQIECVKYINESLGFHREDGPAYITWFPDGIKYYEGYFMNNSAHRVDGPATQYFHTNGNKEFEIYYLNGIKHREDGPDAAAKALALGKAEEALVVRFGQSAGPGGLRTSGVSGQYSDTCVEMAAFYTLWNNAMLVGRFDELLTKAADTFGQANVLFVRQNGNTVPVSIKMGDVWVIMGLQCPTTNCAHALGCLQYCPASTCLRLPPGMKAPPGAKEDSKDTIVDADWETFCRTDPGKSLKGAPKFAAFKDKYKREPTKVSTGHRKQPGATSVPVDMLEYEACLAKAQGSISPPPSLVTTG